MSASTRYATVSLKEMSGPEFFNYAIERIQYLEDRSKYYNEALDMDVLLKEFRTLIAIAEEKVVTYQNVEGSYEL